MLINQSGFYTFKLRTHIYYFQVFEIRNYCEKALHLYCEIDREFKLHLQNPIVGDKLVNIPIINFPKFSISLKVIKILNTVSYIPGSKMDSILFPIYN